ncbi:MAG: ral substrate transporter [Sphingomonas bacterium]|uniref:MFS transporter n=1 Tax=Sphingomonas bacterium TaxID=1895847 RepID=UPI002625BCCB|nr:MFS transporter [Sphingomonas bacterium]MDB5708220.1 ral substrate transporter [Sphingomonas bacterium]
MTEANPQAVPRDAASDRAPLFSASKVVAVVIGNSLEFYDFLSFTFFSVNLARVMFPAGLPGTALLLTLMTGSLGFFARPVGAVLFGLLGDRIGRRPMMLATFTLMGVGALGLALTPNYASIGIAAPILVVAFRVIQGVAAGGDVGPTTAYLAECAPLARRGLFTSLQLAAMRLGALASGVAGLTLASVLSPAALDAFGWRIAFGIGAAIVPFAFFLRRRLEETLHLPEADPRASAVIEPTVYGGALLGVFGGLVMSSMSDFFFTYATTWLGVAAPSAYRLTVAIGAVQVASVLIGGMLADRVGRRAVKLAPALLGALVAVPLFGSAVAAPGAVSLAIAVLPLTALAALAMPPAYITLVEASPKHMRSGLVGIGYGLVVAAAFGIAPPLVAAYVRASHDLVGPAYAWMLGFVLMAISAVITRETHPARHLAVHPLKLWRATAVQPG